MKERTLFLILIKQSQKPPPEIPDNCIEKLSDVSKMLVTLANEGVLIGPLLIKIVKACLYHVIDVGENLVNAQVISWSLATEVNCDLITCKNLIR